MDASKKLQWLQCHDRQSGDLYGMLPICFGMPVFLTDHLDRSRDKNLLRGTKGTVDSWVLHADDESDTAQSDVPERVLAKLPIVVFVRFSGAKWRLPAILRVCVRN